VLFLFGLVLSGGFPIRYPFPEIRREVPTNFERTEFFDALSPFGFRPRIQKTTRRPKLPERRVSNV
jgi:hypothetical protein